MDTYSCIQKYTLTSHSSILWVAIGAVYIGAMQAFSKVILTTTAVHIIKVKQTSTSTKMRTAEGYCICWPRLFYCYSDSLKHGPLHWPWVEYPSCRQATVASAFPQESPHTVPHTLFMQISTLPSFAMLPPASLSWPFVQGAVNKVHMLEWTP